MALIPSRTSPPTVGEHSRLKRGPHFAPLVATRLPAPSHLIIAPQAISSTASLISHFPFFFHGGLDFDHIWLGNRRYPSDAPFSSLWSADATLCSLAGRQWGRAHIQCSVIQQKIPVPLQWMYLHETWNRCIARV